MTDERTSLDPERPDELLTQDQADAPLLDHNYDGIQEYDNPMPAWWTWLFILTVVWSGAYIIMIETGLIQKYEAELADGLAEIRALQQQAAASLVDVDQAYLAALSGDAARIANGQAVYDRMCASCHSADGSGGIGNSLNSGDWRHGGTLVDIYTVVRDGVAAAGMPAWGNIMSHEDMVDATLFIETFGAVVAVDVPTGAAPSDDAPAPSDADAGGAADTHDEAEGDPADADDPAPPAEDTPTDSDAPEPSEDTREG